MLVTRIFPFSHNVFKSLLFWGRQKSGLCCKELKCFFASLKHSFQIGPLLIEMLDGPEVWWYPYSVVLNLGVIVKSFSKILYMKTYFEMINSLSLIFQAVRRGHRHITWLLLESGANFNLKSVTGHTALNYAQALRNIDTESVIMTHIDR